ncbi:S1 RNA-binding domain-containing protein [Streptococcus pneumoniae]|nr:S1 RNA-binding domain-containing protein [Streptococcus pneumoniae]VJG94821.1 S1 RNA-binding domain-containing protein [Streptococcus pneumoniae]VJL61688.1 S1 RNA-binding domain-containing protein [Streptococcus pneumoniae]VKN34165.1 S1 RNA-binding domain-containing protein [Streptococcus pneumoniae]VKS43103.1 S1 RNA-binding domain-containing protein [Streptococcus pneumoniae]
MILFENLFKPGQLHLAVDMLLTSSVLSATSKQCFELTSSVLSATSKQCFELTSSVLSTTSKQCFEQPVTSFLIDVLIFIAYNQKEKFSPEKHIE